MTEETFQAIGWGIKNCTVNTLKTDHKGNVYYKRFSKFFPFKHEWLHKGANMIELMKTYEENSLVDLDTGEKVGTIRLYPFSFLDFQTNFTRINPELNREMQSIKAEKDHYKMVIIELLSLIDRAGIESKVKQKILDDYKFFTKDIGPAYFPKSGKSGK